MPLVGGTSTAPAFYEMAFDKTRFVQVVTVIGNVYNSFAESKNWFVTVGENSLSVNGNLPSSNT